jgi:hypothetical protein
MTDDGLAATIRLGDPRTSLEALRDELAEALEAADPAVKAQLAGQLRAVLKDLSSLSDDREVSTADDLAKRRADRIAGADAAAPPRRRANNRRK